MTNTSAQQGQKRPVGIVVRKHGAVSDDQITQARELLETMLAEVGEPVLGVEMALTLLREPAPPKPALAQVTVALKGRLVRARAAGTTPEQAASLLRDRLALRVGRPWGRDGDLAATG
ncbi:hypothetical protein [Actinocorallia longicatena]|uniref:ANTAR domain-containing protein n=1 Tax=Actinocorallia longicatena TaxID=111803 RepID=A0ABP6QEL4_9ACTN